MGKVNCPLMGECIDDAVCFDIHIVVVERCAPEFTAPQKQFRHRISGKYV